MKKYLIDLWDISSQEEFHEKIREGLPVPEYYGNNLDALHDVLTSLEEGEIVVTGTASAVNGAPRLMSRFLRLAADLNEEEENVRIIFR